MMTFRQFLLEGVKTKDSSGDKFEVLIAKNLEKLIANAKLPFTVSRQVEDRKFYSDIKVENGSKRIWLETKLNKRASLGGPSFKYSNGAWTCTTAGENPLADYYVQLLTDNSNQFISFCKKKLGESFTLPHDLPNVIDAWRKAHKSIDGRDDILSITASLSMNDFGDKIAKFYTTVKREPAYYIQIDDSLFILDPLYNPLNLKTKDGKDLKTISSVYRSGTIQFRAKGEMKKLKAGGKYYYNIVADIKLDEAFIDDDYACSLKTESKFPVISKP